MLAATADLATSTFFTVPAAGLRAGLASCPDLSSFSSSCHGCGLAGPAQARRLLERGPNHPVADLAVQPGDIDLARLIFPGRQPDVARASQPRRTISAALEGDRHDGADAEDAHQLTADRICTNERERFTMRTLKLSVERRPGLRALGRSRSQGPAARQPTLACGFRGHRAHHSDLIARGIPRIVRAAFRGDRAQFERPRPSPDKSRKKLPSGTATRTPARANRGAGHDKEGRR
jgi:hypothetical protein